MATMVKEKSREKHKSKNKRIAKVKSPSLPHIEERHPDTEGEIVTNIEPSSSIATKDSTVILENTTQIQSQHELSPDVASSHVSVEETGTVKTQIACCNKDTIIRNKELQTVPIPRNPYEELNSTLGRITIENNVTKNIIDGENDISSAYRAPDKTTSVGETHSELSSQNTLQSEMHTEAATRSQQSEIIAPSAPVFEEDIKNVTYVQEEVANVVKPKIQCITLQEAVMLCGGKEMAEIMAMSEREEAAVEAGPLSGPDNPLVDLLSTFRSSLIAVERERAQLACGFLEEEKSRSALWKIEKRNIHLSETCPCGANVGFYATYEHAELLKEKLPVAKLRLEGLMRDVQDSYCHHQHAALLAHCQIEDLISEVIKSNKLVIRESLSLILEALRRSDGAPEALPSALQRWAGVLANALVDKRDLRQLLYLLHHLFKQSRSVSWAVRAIKLGVEDSVSAAQAIALLDVLLARPKLESAQECTEETDDVWEEVDKHGEGGAVSEGTLREKDLLALLYAFPLRDIVARLVLFTHADIRNAREPEWGDASGGHGVLRACFGVRALLAALQRAALAHTHYARLHRALRDLASKALVALSCLYRAARTPYNQDLLDKITVELEAVFVAAFNMFGDHELYDLPATLLADDRAKDYCITFILGLHDKSPKRISTLSVMPPVISCEERVRIVSQAAIDREHDDELARIVLEFLFQTGIKRKCVQCKGACDSAAREWLPRLLAAHPYLHTVALHTIAELHQIEPLDASSVGALHMGRWRGSSGEILAVLDNWSQRCPQLLQHLLLQLDYTPHTGLPLEVQLTIGSWLCKWVAPQTTPPEWAWQVLRQLRVHRLCWNLPLDAPTIEVDREDLFAVMYAVLSSSWGDCVPLICSDGVPALCLLAARRIKDAVHCLSFVMIVMAQSPESVSYTPKFAELISTLVSAGGSLVARALGRAPAAGAQLLASLVLAHVQHNNVDGSSRSSILSTWLHALWNMSVPVSAWALADLAGAASREWPTLDAYADMLMQSENAKEYISQAVRCAASAPLPCACVLHAARARTAAVRARLLPALALQRARNHKIHVDNALQQISAGMSSEELTIYRAAAAGMSAPLHHPSTIAIWRLFFELYLERVPVSPQENSIPVGPLFYSGLIKSRALSQIKKRIQEIITYHQNRADSLKGECNDKSNDQSTSRVVKSSSITIDDNMLPTLTINDLTGESSTSSDSDSDSAEEGKSHSKTEKEVTREDKTEVEKNNFDMLCYHVAAAKLFREYARWLEEGEKVQAAPHQADMARFIPERALEAAWRQVVPAAQSAAGEVDPSWVAPTACAADGGTRETARAPLHVAVSAILAIRQPTRRRSLKCTVKSPVEDVDNRDARSLLALIDKHLKDIERLAQDWYLEVSRVSSLDAKLWELVGELRVRRQLAPVKRQCLNKCKAITFVIPAQEWCISTGAERGIKDNRRSAATGVRRLARARPHAARTVAALHAIARRINNGDAAVCVLERTWRCAGTCAPCSAAHAALTSLADMLAERWVCHNGALCSELVSRWGGDSRTPLQQSLCGALVCPRRMPLADWHGPYLALLKTNLPPHTIFSYMSRFELSRWAESAGPVARRQLVAGALEGAGRWASHGVLVELLGVQARAALDSHALPDHVRAAAAAMLASTLPTAYCAHLVEATAALARGVSFDQLGHLLRELGASWWEVRAGRGRGAALAPYAPHVGRLLQALQRAFVAAAITQTYEPERVGEYAWSSIVESWSAWVLPHPATPPLLPSTSENEEYTPMLKLFVETIQQVMFHSRGCEVHILQQVFKWVIHTHVAVMSGGEQESRVQLSALLAALAHLPWHRHQWFYGDCLQPALQISISTDREIMSWCCAAWRCTNGATLARGLPPAHDARLLTELLYLFTATHLPHAQETLEAATTLPWWRLPLEALEEGLERFFAVHYNNALAYHDLPQFIVLMYASELRVHASWPADSCWTDSSTRKRLSTVSQWTRAASAPGLHAHVHDYCNKLLTVITDLADIMMPFRTDLEILLGRALVIMCVEPAAAAALPVWQQWVRGASPRLVRACVAAAGTLTAFQYFAALGDVVVRAHLDKQVNGWRQICDLWGISPWTCPVSVISTGKLYCAYAVALTHLSPDDSGPVFTAIANAEINYVENEVIVAVWLCYASRVAAKCSAGSAAVAAARDLLARVLAAPKRSLLRAVVMQTDTTKPTAKHRLLCQLAQCVLGAGALDADSALRAYHAACTSVLGAGAATALAEPLHAAAVPRLALRLFPTHESHFRSELVDD